MMLVCPNCKGCNLMVIETRSKTDTVRRRRKCLDCDYRFSTIEVDLDQYKMLPVLVNRIRELVPMMDKVRGIMDSIVD